MDTVSPEMDAAFLAHRAELLRFFRARGAGDAAEDLLHETWVRLPRAGCRIDAPLAYLYRMANSLVIKRHLREVGDMRRDRAWSEATGPVDRDRSDEPGADRVIEAREAAAQVLGALAGQGERVFRIFHRHRVDGLTQREVAAELHVSISTVESDLRRARQVLAAWQRGG